MPQSPGAGRALLPCVGGGFRANARTPRICVWKQEVQEVFISLLAAGPAAQVMLRHQLAVFESPHSRSRSYGGAPDERYGVSIGGDFLLGARHQMTVSFEAHRFLVGCCCPVRGRQLVAPSRQTESS